MSPEDQRVWEEDAETEYAEAHAQARPATHGPADAEKVSQDVGEVERARVARWEFIVQNTASYWPRQKAEAAMRLAGEEHAALVAEVERLQGQVQRVRALADAFADDGLSRYGGNIAWHIEEAIANEKGDFPDAADIRIASQRERAESAEAEVERLRVRLAKVEALADEWERMAEGMRPGSVEWSYRGKAAQLRAVLADARTEQTCPDTVVHWVGDAPTSLHGNGAASFAHTAHDAAKVTCRLCLSLLARGDAPAEQRVTFDSGEQLAGRLLADAPTEQTDFERAAVDRLAETEGIRFCDDKGIIVRGPGIGWTCTGSVHYGATEVPCASPVHVVSIPAPTEKTKGGE